jgi:hypothetical protein
VSDKVAFGAAVSYATSLQKNEYAQVPNSTYKSVTNSFGIGPYIRYYIPISGSIYFGLQGGLGFSRNTVTVTQYIGAVETTTDVPTYQLGISARPIFIFFPSRKWGIETSIGSLGYSYTKTLPDGGTGNSFGLTAGSLSLGIAYYFLKK